MGCTATLSLSTSSPDQPMDSAAFNSVDGFIYGVRGGRIFRCDAGTGSIVSFADYNLNITSQSSIAYAAVNNTLWAGGWNDQTSFQAHGNAIPATYFFGPRSIQKIDPGTLTVLQSLDLDANLPSGNAPNVWNSGQQPTAGIQSLKYVGTSIYAGIWSYDAGVSIVPVKFDPTNIATHVLGFSNLVAGQFAWSTGDFIWAPDVTFPRITQVNMATGALVTAIDTWPSGGTATIHTFFPLAIEFSNETGALFVTSKDVGAPGDGSWIYRLSTAPAEVLRFNNTRTNFNGIHIRRCPQGPNIGKLYAAGFGDNSVLLIDPNLNSVTVKLGFDLPWDFVFTPTKVWCVQQGSTPLKEVV